MGALIRHSAVRLYVMGEDAQKRVAKAMAKSGRGVWQVVPFFPDLKRELENIRELGEISLAANVLCSLQPVLSSPGSPDAVEIISALEAEQARGARVYGQVMRVVSI